MSKRILTVLLLSIAGSLLCLPVHAGQNGFYIQLDAGRNWGSSCSNGSSNSGLVLDVRPSPGGHIVDHDLGNGNMFKGALGYRINDLLRADITYTELASSDVSWRGSFNNPYYHYDSTYTASRNSHVLLANFYFHARGISPEIFSLFDPFVGVGVGLADNQLKSIHETYQTSPDALPFATIDRRNKLNPAVRVGLGTDVTLSQHLTFTFSVDGYWLGTFETGDSRVTDSTGTIEELNPWKLEDSIVISSGVGLRYIF